MRLRPWQRAFIYRLYELDEHGQPLIRQALLGLPKGNGKTEIAAFLGCYELLGQRHISPSVVVAAASFEQADRVFGAMRTVCRESPSLKQVADPYDTEILIKGNVPGRAERVAAAAGTNDGGRSTCMIADELHEWTGNKERVHLVLANNTAKRQDSLQLNITTAGWDRDSLCYRMYEYGRRWQAGEIVDPHFLFEWWQAPEDSDPADEALWHLCNPALGDFLPEDNIRRQQQLLPPYEFDRYHRNMWTDTPERWLPVGAWDTCARPDQKVQPGQEIVLGFDGAYSGDSTALVGCTLKGHLFVLDAWERPEHEISWHVNVTDCENAIRKACSDYKVRAVAMNPMRWQRTLSLLAEEGLPIHEFPSNSVPRMVAACAQFYDGVAQGTLTHDGDARLAAHVDHAVVKIDSRGPRISKDHKLSSRHIDLAVAAVMAFDLVSRLEKPAVPARLVTM